MSDAQDGLQIVHSFTSNVSGLVMPLLYGKEASTQHKYLLFRTPQGNDVASTFVIKYGMADKPERRSQNLNGNQFRRVYTGRYTRVLEYMHNSKTYGNGSLVVVMVTNRNNSRAQI